MKIKSLFWGSLALLGLAVSCQEPENSEPAVILTSDAVVNVGAEGADAVAVTFTSATAWELRGLDDCGWLVADKLNGKGSADEQKLTLSISPNPEGNREVSFTIYASPLAKKTVTVKQAGEKGDGVADITIAEFLELKNTTQSYRLGGVIGDIARSTSYYGFTLKDETGEVSCPFPANWDSYSAALHTGDRVIVEGVYSYYESKNQDQVKNANILSHTPADASSVTSLTVSEFLAKADKFSRYRLTGTVSGTVNATYCSFDLKDETGTVKVYTVNNASEWGSKIAVGGKVTLVGAYTLYTNSNTGSSTPEVVDADIESFEGGAEVPGADPAGEGTKESPYNVAKAIAVTQALAADAYSETEVYVEGIVSDMGKGIDLSFGNATFYISDDGETANQFYIYRLLDVGGAKFTDVNRFKKGDKVLLYGKLQNYKGNTPELAQGSQLVAVNGSEAVPDYMNLSTDALAVKSAAGSVSFNISSNMSWTVSSDNAEFSVSPASGRGDASVNVSYGENTTQSERVAVITVVAGEISKTVTIRQAVAGSTEDNLLVAEQGKDYLAANKDGKLDDVISYTNSTDYGTTVVTELRVYKNMTLGITAAEGYSIASVELTCTAGANKKQGYYDSYIPTLDSGASATVSINGMVATIDITGNTSSFSVVAAQNQIRITNMKVTYFKK